MTAVPWPFVLVMAFFGAVIVASGYVLAVLPEPRSATCDRLFAEFITTKDSVIVNRNGWLLYELHCNVSHRYRQGEK
jgi:hypothetical protein